RVFVEAPIHDQLVDKLVAISQSKVVGDPLSRESQLGAIVSEEQYGKVLGYLDSGKAEKATVAFGGEKAHVPGCDGFFVQPTVFTDVNNSMTIAREEIFGPVLSVIPFKDADDAINQANKTIYGLAAGIWTNDVKKAHRVARAIKAGTVWINTYNAF